MAQQLVNPLGAVQEGQNYVDGLFAQNANRLAGGLLAGGDTKGAASTLYRAGDLTGGRQIMTQAATDATNARTQQTADSARQLQTTMQVVKALKAQRDAGQDVSTALLSYRPTFLALGTNPQEFDQIAAQIAANPAFLDQVEALTAQAMDYELRAGNNGDTVAVGLNKQTGQTSSRLAYAAPQAPQITQFGVLNPPARPLPVGQDTAYQPGTSTGAAILPGTQPLSQAAPAAATGAAISANPLWSRQVQQESGGQQFGANGQVLTSPAGAFGVAQLMPGTASDMARQMGVSVEQLRSDPALNEAAGQRYQQQQLEKYGGNEALALAAYNAGPARVDEWIQRFGDPRTGEITTEEFVARIPFAETKNYVENITQGQYGQGDNEGSAGQQASGLEQLGGGYTLQRMQTPADQRAERSEARQDRAETRAEAIAARQARNEERTNQRLDSAESKDERVGISQLRREFTALPEVKEFREVDNAYRRMLPAIQNPSPAGDISLIFGYMKGQDPTSTVREGEFATAQNAGSLPESVVNMYNKALSGERLNPRQRQDFYTQTRYAHTARQERFNQIRGEYEREATILGYDPQRVLGGVNEQGQRQRQTNAPGIPFNVSPQQLQARQRLVGTGANPSSPVGSPLNPRYVNPADERGSYANIQPGQWFVAPDGAVLQKPTERRR